MNKEVSGWIQTYSGRKFFPLNPEKDSIVIQDIAHSLSHICRFTGHVKAHHYSVAQHSVLVSYVCNYEDRLHALLHDGSEFALTDLPSPVKKLPEFEFYRQAEHKLQSMIYERFGLSPIEPQSVKLADIKMLATEVQNFMSPVHSEWILPCDPLPFKIEPLNSSDAKDLFMKRFFELTNAEPRMYEHYLEYEYGK